MAKLKCHGRSAAPPVPQPTCWRRRFGYRRSCIPGPSQGVGGRLAPTNRRHAPHGPDTGDTGRGGALLQQQLRQLAGRVGLTVVGSEVKEPVQLEALVKLNATLKVTGGPDDFDEFFQLLYGASPALLPGGMQAEALRRINRRLRNPDAATADLLSGRVDVAAFRLSEPND